MLKSCANENHRRAVAPVRCCPNCGGIVNERIPARRCPDPEHVKARLARLVFCVNCGKQVKLSSNGGVGQ